MIICTQIYLPVCNADHWILILVSLSGELVEIYDSLKPYKRGEDPYKGLWETIVRSSFFSGN
jgi:Ulp1 family protease